MCAIWTIRALKKTFLFLVSTSAELCLPPNSETPRQRVKPGTERGAGALMGGARSKCPRVLSQVSAQVSEHSERPSHAVGHRRHLEGVCGGLRERLEENVFDLVVSPDSYDSGAR